MYFNQLFILVQARDPGDNNSVFASLATSVACSTQFVTSIKFMRQENIII